MKKIVFAAVATAMLGATGAAFAQDQVAKLGCNTCHDIEKKKMAGPYKGYAAKYKGNADAEKMLTEKLVSGKGHVKAKGTPEEVGAAVKWILAQ